MDSVFKSFIDSHMGEANSDTEATDFIGAYLRELNKEKHNEDSTFEGIMFALLKLKRTYVYIVICVLENNQNVPWFCPSEKQLIQIIGDLFTAGTETTATTLLWGLTYMMRNPEVQEELHKEIDTILGPDQPPSYKDRDQMPYTEACLLEIQVLKKYLYDI